MSKEERQHLVIVYCV